MLEVGFAHVKQRLSRHRGEFDLILGRHEGEHRFHERGFAGRRRGLNDDGERLVQLSRHGGEVADELFVLLAHHFEISNQAFEQLGVFEQPRGRFPLFGRHRRFHVFGHERGFDLLVLQLLEQNSPDPRVIEAPEQGDVNAIPYVGGLHHRYARAA